MAGALGFGILGVGSGIALAKPGNPHPNPHGPGVSAPVNPGNGNGQGNGHGNGQGEGDGQGSGSAYGGDDRNENWGGYGGRDADEGGNWSGGNVHSSWMPWMPPGQNPFGPPGQVMKMSTLTLPTALTLPNGTVVAAGTTVPNPFLNTPPGQWGTVDLNTVLNGINPAVLSWIPPDSGLTTPLPLEWNAQVGAWGVTVDGVFTPYPMIFPAPGTTG